MTVRVTLTKSTPLGSFPDLPLVADSADLIWTAADATNKDQFVAGGNDLVLARNVDVADPFTVTITSVPDDEGRSGDITAYSIAAGEVAMLGPFKRHGWMQSDGKIYLEASNLKIEFAIVALP